MLMKRIEWMVLGLRKELIVPQSIIKQSIFLELPGIHYSGAFIENKI